VRCRISLLYGGIIYSAVIARVVFSPET